MPKKLNPMLYDVVVIGGGISGCAATYFLAQRNIKVALLDKRPPTSEKICTTAINPRSTHYLKKLNLLETLERKSYTKVRGLQTFAYDHSSFQGHYEHESSFPHYGYCIPRFELDLMLRQQSISEKSVDYYEPFEVQSVEHCPITKLNTVQGKSNGENRTLQSKIVIDAMGRNSVVAKKEDLFFNDHEHERYALLAQFSGLNSIDPMFTIGTNEVVGPGYYTVFPINPNGIAMVALIIPKKQWQEFNPKSNWSLEQFVKNIDSPIRSWFKNAKQNSKTLSFGPIAFHSKAYFLPGILMVGDSTGFFDPLTGEGLTQAFITGELASQAAERYLLDNDFPSAAHWYSEKVKLHKDETLKHSRQLQSLLNYPNAFNRFIYSLSQNQKAANWLACAVGNILPPGERVSNKLKEILFATKVSQ